MVYRGKVKDGVIVLDQPATFPEGTRVTIEAEKGEEVASGPTLAETLGDLIGSVTDLPSDFALNHDHYIHGAPKK